ncbi:MAG: hypothetical protein HQK49_17295 [Oligoflexia bacterium]|nr:hypothetical protein [Oligoflexia bacterium]
METLKKNNLPLTTNKENKTKQFIYFMHFIICILVIDIAYSGTPSGREGLLVDAIKKDTTSYGTAGIMCLCMKAQECRRSISKDKTNEYLAIKGATYKMEVTARTGIDFSANIFCDWLKNNVKDTTCSDAISVCIGAPDIGTLSTTTTSPKIKEQKTIEASKLSGANPSKNSLELFNFVFDCSPGPDHCTHGKLPKNMKVTVFGVNPVHKCILSTGDTTKYESVMSDDLIMTKIEDPQKCLKPKTPYYLFKGDVKKIEELKLVPIEDKSVLNRLSGALVTARIMINNQSFKGKTRTYSPMISQIWGTNFFLLTYKKTTIDSTPSPGPVFIISGTNTVMWLEPQICQVQNVKIFKMDNEIYIRGGTTCCNCGWTNDTLYKYDPESESFISVFSTNDWST